MESQSSGLNTFPLRYSVSFTRQRRFSLWPDSQMHSFCDSQRKAAGTAERIDCTLWIYPLERPQAVLHFVTTAQQRNYEASRVSAICRPLSSTRKKTGDARNILQVDNTNAISSHFRVITYAYLIGESCARN